MTHRRPKLTVRGKGVLNNAKPYFPLNTKSLIFSPTDIAGRYFLFISSKKK